MESACERGREREIKREIRREGKERKSWYFDFDGVER